MPKRESDKIMTEKPSRIVLTAPDGCTKYLAASVESTLAAFPGATVAVRCTESETKLDLAEWCLRSGRRIANPFAHYLDDTLQIEDQAPHLFERSVDYEAA